MNTIECPRCLGKKIVDENDIKRMKREGEWLPGPCAYCDETGIVDFDKMEVDAVDEVDLVSDSDQDITNLISTLTEKIAHLVIAGKSDNQIVSELEKEGYPKVITEQLLERVKVEIEEIKGKAHRNVAGEYLLKGVGFLVLGAIITGVTYSMASGGGSYVVTTGLFAVGGIYTVIGVFKFLANL